MKLIRRLLALCACVGMLGIVGAGHAIGKTQDLVLNNDAKCTTCHDEGDSPRVLQIGRTRHGTLADKRVGTCTNCHGQSDRHIADAEKGLKNPTQPDIDFTKHSKTPMEKRSATCLTCHQGGIRIHWDGGPHAENQVACSSCHQIHTQHDPVMDRVTQSEVCFTCHKEQRAEVRRPSHHPIEEGKVSCSDCHNPHGTAGPHLLVRNSVNDTCYTCHMEKRGPFVHNHEPVSDDCTNCHNPHGTVNDSMLKMRPPMLCHQCHSPHGAQVLQLLSQQGVPGSANLTSGKNGVNYLMGRGCLNCHTAIHGTNNPAAGATLNPTPQFMFR